MIRKSITLCCFWMLGALASFGKDVQIERVVAFSNEVKTSVVIYYSGTEKLRFFALDVADGVFALDMPGVFSKFDFSTLAFPQVLEVRQAPLDPDANKGLSVRFFLAENAEYEVFEGALGELTLFFEAQPEQEPVEALAEATPAASETAPQAEPLADEYEAAAPSGETAFFEIAGAPGENRLSGVVAAVEPRGGRLFLNAPDLLEFKRFSLTSPERFVIDLQETVLSLNQNDLILNHPLVETVRIRQFQSKPTAVTRVVFDLAADVNFNAFMHEGGLAVLFAESPERLEAMMSQFDALAAVQPQAEPSETTAVDPVEVTPRTSGLDALDEETVDPEPELAMEPEPEMESAVAATESDGADAEPLALEPEAPAETPAENATVAADQTEMSYQDPPALAPEPATVDEVGGELQMSLAAASEQVVVAHRDIQEQTEAMKVDAAPSEAVATVPAADMPMEEAPAVAEATAEDALPESSPSGAVDAAPPAQSSAAEPVPAIEEPAEVPADPQPLVAESAPAPAPEADETLEDAGSPAAEPSLAAAQTQDLPVLPADEPVIDEGWVAQAEQPMDLSEIRNLLGPAEASDDAADAAPEPAKPRFEVASDIDREMQEFLDGGRKKTIYGMMKGMNSNRPVHDSIVVTNANIEKSKMALSESRSMQDDMSDEDFAALFREDEPTDNYETIAGGEEKYRGFELSIIDVKDANVVDLLRFIADQVGINLYVDSSVGDLKATYRFRNIPWDQALDIILTNANLDKEFRNGVLRVATTEKFRQEELAKAALREQRELAVPVETVTLPLNYADAEEVLPIVEEYLSPRGTILMDERTNMLIIEDIPKKIVAIRALLKRLDRMIAQVTIEARVVETTKRFLKELGIQWGLSAEYSPELGTNTGVDFPNRLGVGGPSIGGTSPGGLLGGYAVNFPVVAENPSGFGLTLGNFLDNFKLDISLQMLESEGYGQIVSSPKITTQNNKTAIIKNGQRIPIQTVQRGTITTRYIDAVLELQVTPHITSDETIIMDLVVDKSEPDFTRQVEGNPVINIRRAETKVLVKNGGTAVIGGIFTLNESSTEVGIPGLRRVPVLKRLFSREQQSYENQELLIFVTPRIVKY